MEQDFSNYPFAESEVQRCSSLSRNVQGWREEISGDCDSGFLLGEISHGFCLVLNIFMVFDATCSNYSSA